MGKTWTQRHRQQIIEITAKTCDIPPFPNDTAALRAARIRQVNGEGWSTFSWFCRTYFPHVFGLPFCDAHRVMFEQVDEHSGITAITGFRGLGKTVLMGVVYPIWRIIRGERFVIHAAADVALAMMRTAFTRHELTNNARLMRDFPDLTVIAEVDEDTGYFLRNKTCILARSIKQSYRGAINPRTARRPGLIVCDDIDKEENQGNQSIGRKRRDKIVEEVTGALDPRGQGRVVWLGNLVHPNYAICQFLDSVKGELKANLGEDVLQSAPILRTRERAVLRFPLENPDGTSAWEEQYPTESLPDVRAKYGHTGYQREMLGQPIIEGNIFKHHWFQTWKDLPKMKRVWLYADPAWGEKGCYKAIISIGYDGSRFYVIHCWVRQTENTRFFQYLHDAWKELNKLFGVRFRASIETAYGQGRILTDFDRWARDNGLMSLAYQFKHINTKEKKTIRIERTETAIETGKVLFPDGQDTPTLISQFLTYPDGYVDGPDALAGCLERFTEYDVRGRARVRLLEY